jgi:hypothetical protein
VGVHISDLGLLNVRQVEWLEDACTKDLQKYLDEYFYRLNRLLFKETIFDNLFKRLVNHEHNQWSQIVLNK